MSDPTDPAAPAARDGGPPLTPVYQSICRFPGGDCFPACVASIFGLRLLDVPNFFADTLDPAAHMTQEQWDAIREFSEARGRRAFWIDPDAEHEYARMLAESGLYYVAFGPSHGGEWGHCVVMHRGENAHDPAGHGFLAGKPWLYVGFEPIPGWRPPMEHKAARHRAMNLEVPNA